MSVNVETVFSTHHEGMPINQRSGDVSIREWTDTRYGDWLSYMADRYAASGIRWSGFGYDDEHRRAMRVEGERYGRRGTRHEQ